MNLVFVKIIFVCLIQGIFGGVGSYEERVEYVNSGQVSAENETTETLPGAIVLELNRALLENIKMMWRRESEISFSEKKTLLATFDSTGLLNVSLYNETSEFLQDLTKLTPTMIENRQLSPTLHVLGELVEKNHIPNGSLLLVTMSKPSDEGFRETLTESLKRKNLKMSVLWLGDQTTDYTLLKDMTMRTGGVFKFSSVDPDNGESIEDGYLQKSMMNAENFSERVRFPEESPSHQMPLTARAEDQRVLQRSVVPLIVEVASGTNLEARPGTPTQIQFTVKNNINVAVSATFYAKFNGIRQIVQPTQAWLQPSDTHTVIVNLQPIGSAQNSALGTLTLAAEVANRVTARSALISLTPQTITDRTRPKMYHKFEGDCTNYREPQNCENGHWTLEATIQDDESGLLKILSEPYGLLFQSEFIAGTKNPETVFYRATCCQPIVHIWAEDLKGNYVKKQFDVFNQNLLAGEIASIVLGILLILFIIIGVIIAVVLVRRRNRRNMIIPRVRSGSR